MKSFVVFMSVLAVGLCTAASEEEKAKQLKCNLESVPAAGPVLPSTEWIDIKDSCVDLARQQIRMEFKAALAYLQLGAYFNQYDVNRPGFAKFFFGAATEERSHAIKIFDYLLMRGQLTQHHTDPQLHTLLMGSSSNKSMILDELSEELNVKDKKVDGLDGLNKALGLEVSVTRSIKRMIKVCENETNVTPTEKKSLDQGPENLSANDYHMVDWLITDLLDEQLNGQRELAGRISTLHKMRQGYGQIADFLYDKKLLEELDAKTA